MNCLILIETLSGPVEFRVVKNSDGSFSYGAGRCILTGQRKVRISPQFAQRLYNALHLKECQEVSADERAN